MFGHKQSGELVGPQCKNTLMGLIHKVITDEIAKGGGVRAIALRVLSCHYGADRRCGACRRSYGRSPFYFQSAKSGVDRGGSRIAGSTIIASLSKISLRRLNVL